MSTVVVVALISVAVLGANLAYVLRPGVHIPWNPSDTRVTPGAGGWRGWVGRHHSTLLCLSRGTLNGSVATCGLIQVGYPVPASIAEGLTAGFLSGFFQATVMNERFSAYLNRASSEVHRVAKWAWFQALFYGLVKAAGTLAGGGPADVTSLFFAYALTITFGSAQYPWEAAIAARRSLRTEQGASRDRVRLVADLQTMAVSVTCVGVSILNSVGVAGSRLFLAAVGVAGVVYYGMVRLRRAGWRYQIPTLPSRPDTARLIEVPPAWAPEPSRAVAVVKN